MGRHLHWIAAGIAAAAMTLASSQGFAHDPVYGSGYMPTRTVRCESIGSRQTFCRVNTMGGVRIARQLSQRSCIQGRNWSYSSRGILVSGGCRADFMVGRGIAYRPPYGNPSTPVRDDHYVDSSGRLIHCESTASGRTYCGTSHTRYTMAGNRDPDCIQGQTWGTDDRGVWVSGDCDADFNSSPYDNNEAGHTHYVDSSGRLIHCQATASGRTYCGTSHTRYTMAGNRDPDCIEGQTWGYDERGTWVSGDCNADFDTSPYDNNEAGHSHYVDSSGQLIHCQSTASGRTYCGTQHTGYEMAGNRDPDCIEGQTWGMDDRGVWVSGDCDADFSVDPNYEDPYHHH